MFGFCLTNLYAIVLSVYRWVPLYPNMLKAKLAFIRRITVSKPHLNQCCVILHTSFEICVHRRLFTWYCLFGLSGTHLYVCLTPKRHCSVIAARRGGRLFVLAAGPASAASEIKGNLDTSVIHFRVPLKLGKNVVTKHETLT